MIAYMLSPAKGLFSGEQDISRDLIAVYQYHPISGRKFQHFIRKAASAEQDKSVKTILAAPFYLGGLLLQGALSPSL